MSKSKFARGSEWRKWDLHVHSPASILNNQFPKGSDGSPDWEAYVTKLEKTDISVLGVTDYFTIEGYKQVLEYTKTGRLSEIDLILPNIEFRLDEILYKGKCGIAPRRLNLHVIFSNELDPRVIEDHFLHNLYFKSRGAVDGKPFKERLKLSNLEKLGRQLKRLLPNEHKDKSDIIVGAENATVRLEDIKKELTDSGQFTDKYVIVMDERNTSLIEWGSQDTQTRLTLLQNSHFVFSSNVKTRSWCLGSSPWKNGRKQYIATFNSLKPCIHGSDAHELFFVGHPCGCREKHDCQSDSENCDLRFCWIKADPTFEGLRQVLYEPEDRVAIQAKCPTPSRYNHSLSQINISESTINSELTVKETQLPLHHSLIAITGGKGAGKTAFVDLIANCFKDKIKDSDRNSFVNRISDKSPPSLEVSIDFTGADSFSKRVIDATYMDVADVAYISQGELDKYIIESTDLTNRVNELIFSRVTNVGKYAFDALTKGIIDAETSVRQLSSEILELESETSPQVDQELETETLIINAKLADLQRQQNALDVDAQDINAAQQVQETIVTLHARRDKLTAIKEAIGSALSILDKDVSRFNALVRKINDDFDDVDESRPPLPEITYSESQKLSQLTNRVEDLLNNTLAEIDAKESERDSLSDKATRHAELLDEIRSETELLKEVQVNQSELQNKRVELLQKKLALATLQREMLERICKKQETLESIIEHFRGQLAATETRLSMSSDLVLGDLDFLAEIRFDQSTFLKEAEDVFDNRSTTGMDYAQNMIKYYRDFADGIDNSITALVNEIEKTVGNEELRTKIKQNRNITLEDFCRVFHQNYFIIEPTVLYRNTRVEGLSLGQKATVLIKVYLAQGIYPIIVDSHDDHLDNHFIMDELIPAIREAKKYRQVILVSNNANVVVNSDAEQIIIAKHDKGNISYVSGSLENPDIRKEALKVLEGGEQAFRKRQEKYRMN